MTLREGLNQLFRVNLELLHEENEASFSPTNVDATQLIGQPMAIEVLQTGGTRRFVNGICIEFTQGNRDQRYTHYRAELVPHVWLLTQRSQSRIYQNISVPDILRKLFSGFEVDYELQGTFEPRNYCVQYRESDWDFASRLMEEEGIYYYFEHTSDKHRMVLGNTPQSHRECPSQSQVPFDLNISQLGLEWQGKIRSWGTGTKLRTGKFTLWDHNFQLPTSNFDGNQVSRFNFGGNQKLEHYDYPGGFAKRFDGIDSSGSEQSSELQKIFDDRSRTVEIRQQELDAGYRNDVGTSDCCSLTAGYRFEMAEHPNADNNIWHVLVTVAIDAVQSPQYVSDEVVSDPYHVNFNSMPHGEGAAPYRPPRKTPKPVVQGSQSATVVGPGGEEIFTDKYGRVKVQFNWDRQGQKDSSSSCWVRVAQTWAGNKWGTMFIPRIGMEVIVDFLEGDPDQPVIIGCVYNPGTMPPYTLPDEKTKSTIKTNSSTGGGGFNELRFEDKAGSEQIFIHAEKNEDIMVKNDCMESIGNDRHLTVENDQKEKIKGDKHLQVVGDHKEKINGSMSLDVGSNIQEKAGQKYAMDAGTEVHIKGGMKVVIEAGMQLTLKAGGNFVDINPTGVAISGTMVMINSGGAAGSGSGSSPDAPADPTAADDSNAGEATSGPSPPQPPEEYGPASLAMVRASESGTPFCGESGSGSSGGGGGAGGGSGAGGGGGANPNAGNVW